MKEAICRLLKVPAEPAPPPGTPPRVFRAAPNYLRLRQLVWCLGLMIFFILTTGVTVAALAGAFSEASGVAALLGVLAVFLWLIFGLELVVGLFVVRLDFEMRWYMVSDRAIRIREGIWTVKEKTIALANIQNISVKQGPLQRMLGIADVEVRTAGGGDDARHQGSQVGEPMHVGYFRGVDNAAEIRDTLWEAARRHAGAGLGDGDDDERLRVDPLVAARELLQEAQALRRTIARRQ